MGVVDTQHLLLIHLGGDPIEHIVHNPAVSDSDVTFSIFESICSPVEIILAHIDKSVVKFIIIPPVTILQCLGVILVLDNEGGVGLGVVHSVHRSEGMTPDVGNVGGEQKKFGQM